MSVEEEYAVVGLINVEDEFSMLKEELAPEPTKIFLLKCNQKADATLE